jgi:hypothetical protein
MKRFAQRLDRLGYATGQLFVFLIAAIVLFFTLVLRGQVTFLPADLVEGSVATLSAASYALLRSRFWSIRGRLLAASFAPVVIFVAQGRGLLFVAVYTVSWRPYFSYRPACSTVAVRAGSDHLAKTDLLSS